MMTPKGHLKWKIFIDKIATFSNTDRGNVLLAISHLTMKTLSLVLAFILQN